MRRNFIFTGIAMAVLVPVGVVWFTRAPAQPPLQNLNAKQGMDGAGPSLPLSQVVLFSSGVGYFQREGEVEGNARIDLQFQIGDVNDLLKSLVLQDLGKGKIGAISYDGQDPIEKTLRSFALDLTGNPTIGQLLNQARGEKVEVVMQTTANGQPGTMTGTIMGMESQMEPAGPNGVREVHSLNLNCAEGMRCINLKEVQRIRFLNARLDAELKRALEVLASSHDSLKKQVTLNFKGDGKRKVRVGYVAENPIWKTSYRLSVGDKTNLQAWAALENITDDDWNDVRVVLVSGRPISFQMDMYPPLYVPRPTVEPERFASLRPPTYNGALTNERVVVGGGASPFTQFTGIGGGIGGMPVGGGALGGGAGGGLLGAMGGFGAGGNNAGFGSALTGLGFSGQFNRYQNGQMARNPAGAPTGGRADHDDDPQVIAPGRRLTYQQLQERRKEQLEAAKAKGAKLANLDPHQIMASEAAGEDNGNNFRYVIEEKVSLPRQKSALLPLLDREITATPVSIFNEEVHGKFPLLGLRFKNTTGQPLTQGPITVFDGGSYAGDARMADLQPDEERLISFAVDLGTEVQATDKLTPGPKMGIRTVNNTLQVVHTIRNTRTYMVRNRSKQARTLIVEHPMRPDWRLDESMKPREQTRDLYRFDVPLKAGESVTFDVHELQRRNVPFQARGSKPSENSAETHFSTDLLLDVHQIDTPQALMIQSIKIAEGELQVVSKNGSTRSYRIMNQSTTEKRTITLEHLVPTGSRLVGAAEAVEGAENLYRFALTVEPGKAVTQTVVEERTDRWAKKLSLMDKEAIQFYATHDAASKAVKEALKKLAEQQSESVETLRQIEEIQKQLREISDDQARLRQNLEKVPATSEAYKRYVKKFDDQETQIEKLQEQFKQKQSAAKIQKKSLEDAFKGLTVE